MGAPVTWAEFAIDTLGASLDAQIEALRQAQERLAQERPDQGSNGRIALADVEGLMDADFTVKGHRHRQLCNCACCARSSLVARR